MGSGCFRFTAAVLPTTTFCEIADEYSRSTVRNYTARNTDVCQLRRRIRPGWLTYEHVLCGEISSECAHTVLVSSTAADQYLVRDLGRIFAFHGQKLQCS